MLTDNSPVVICVCIVGNQFRSLEEDEIVFLDSVADDKREKDRKVKQQETEELLKFRECVLVSAVTFLAVHLLTYSSRSLDCALIYVYRAVAARTTATPTRTAAESPLPTSSSTAKKPEPPKPKGSVIKKDQKTLLKGLVVAKKKSAAKEKSSFGVEKTSVAAATEKGKKREAREDHVEEEDKAKRIKVDEGLTAPASR